MKKNNDLGRGSFNCKEEFPFQGQQAKRKLALEHLIQLVGLYEPTPDGIASNEQAVRNKFNFVTSDVQ